MKKILYSLLTLAAALTVASCQQELPAGADPTLGGPAVTASLTLDLGQMTKAYADGSNATKLSYAFFDDQGEVVASLTQRSIAIPSAAIQVKLSKGAAYTFVAWAESANSIYTISDDFKTVTMATTGLTANNDAYDAFYAAVPITATETSANFEKSITLKRPFAQVNLLVPDGNAASYSAFTSSLTVTGAHTGMNLLDGTLTTATANLTFGATAVDLTETTLKTGYKYLAMNYVFAAADAADYAVSMTVTPDNKTADAAVIGTSEKPMTVSLKRNRRTNLVGNIFATTVDGSITITIGSGMDDPNEQNLEDVAPELEIVLPDNSTTDGKTAVNLPLTTAGGAKTISMSSSNSTGAISFDQAADTDVATVTDNGDGSALVKPVADGTTTFVAHIAAGPTKGNALAKDVTFNVVVGDGIKKGTQTLVFKVGDTAVTAPFADVDESFVAPTLTGAVTTVSYAISPANDAEVLIDAAKGDLLIDATAAAGKTYTVTATAAAETVGGIQYAEATASYSFTVKAATVPPTGDFTTIAGLKDLLGAESASFTGTLTDAVVSFIAGTNDAVIKDASGSILYHKDGGHGLLQGQTISGDVTVDAVIYNGINEITSLIATVEGTGSAVEPEVVTFAQLAANYATYESAYVKVVGVTSNTTTTKKGNIEATQDATNYIVYTYVAIPVNTGDVFTAEGTVTKYNTTEELKVWKAADLTVTTAAPVLSATPAATTVAATATSVTWTITSNTDWTITPGTGVTPSATAGNGNADVTLSFAANTDTASKTLTATAKATGCEDVTITITQNGTNNSDPTWTRVTNVATLLAGGTFIIGYEDTVNSGIIIPMANSGSATTSAAGFMYSGASASSGGTGTINMASVTETSNFEVQIGESSAVNGAIYIKIGDNYLGNANTKNNCKLFAEDNETTAFTPTVTANGIFSFAIDANETYKYLKYNSGSPRFCVYSTAPEKIVVYKKD